MKALVCTQFGKVSDLSFTDIETPQPTDNEVLIKVDFSGLNFPDTLIAQGKYQYKPDFPFSPGQEVTGTIEAIGLNVIGLRVGEEVIASMTYGGIADYCIAQSCNVYRLPGKVTKVHGAAILESFATAFHALKDRGMMKPGQTMAVLGASGGTGQAAIQLGKLFGCRVIAVCSTPEKRQYAQLIGADESIDYSNIKEELKAKGGVDVVFDPVGGVYTEQAFRALKPDGKLLVVGFASGSVPSIPLNLPLLKSAQIVGVFWGGFWRANPDQNRRNVQMLLNWFEERKLTIQNPTLLSFDQAIEGLEMISNRKSIGKIILKH
ncbi:MAG: NADPH:quinone oxidoreductase family protein [Cyclobacteriaceae bacterium]